MRRKSQSMFFNSSFLCSLHSLLAMIGLIMLDQTSIHGDVQSVLSWFGLELARAIKLELGQLGWMTKSKSEHCSTGPQMNFEFPC